MPNVYVVGALLPTGGAYMAYHLGAILQQHFGYELIDVELYKPEATLFDYPTPIRTVSQQQLEADITAEDILIYNPAFSPNLFGLRLPGIKVMYVQDFRTFLLLDCHCDLYVSVSNVVSRYVYSLYGINAPVIPAFIRNDALPAITPWKQRPEHSCLVYMKNPSTEHQLLLNGLKEKLPDIDFSNVLEGRGLSHQEFLTRIGEVRYFINLSLAEGFGLVPLEAMAMGTMVTGVDGLAGRDYLRSGENCLVASITDLRPLPAIIFEAFDDQALAQSCVEKGFATAQSYGYNPFEAAWIKQFTKLLKKEPNA